MPRPIYFDMTADNPERAAMFYGDVFGWTFQKWDGPMDYWMVTTGADGPGIDGGLSRRSNGNAGYNTIDVPSVDDYVTRITGAGGTVIMAKSPIPGVGWFAACADTEGNSFGIMESDPNAG